MKIPAKIFRLFLLAALSVVIGLTAGLETNHEPMQAASPSGVPAQIVIPEIEDLRDQLRAMQRSNEEMKRSSERASEKWTEMAQQNAALSNVLTSLQQTLVTQQQTLVTQNEREIELARQSNSFYIKIISGAAVAVFLVFLFSYWFQLRCLNRVMELSHSAPISVPHEPALLEQDNPATSKLLAAMKLLEHRLEQLEVPNARGNAHTNGDYPEVTSAHTSALLTAAPVETMPNVSLLLAKGQTLLDADRFQDAHTCFQEILAVDPDNAEAHMKKGIALERMNRLDLALASYDEALRLNPKRTVANVHKARVLAAMHRFDEALSVYDTALGKKSPKGETPIFVS